VQNLTDLSDPTMMRALTHPLRVQVLGILQERRSSPVELAKELNESLTLVSYHVRVLADLGLIKLVGKTPRRGAVQHHYEALGPAEITDRTWGKTPSVVKQAMAVSALEEIGRSMSEIAALGGFDRTDAHLTRTHLKLDQRGWEELTAEMTRLLERAEALQRESAERLEASPGEPPFNASMVLMLGEHKSADAEPASPAAEPD
jgi:predicted transcriptional regulator